MDRTIKLAVTSGLVVAYFALAQLPKGSTAGGGVSSGGLCATSIGCIDMPEGANAPTFTAGHDFIYADSVNHEPLLSLNGVGGIRFPWSIKNNIASTSAITTVETIIVQGVVKANAIQAGTAFTARAYGICTSSVANTPTFKIRFGSVGDITDTIIMSQAVTAATTGTTIPWRWEANILFRSTVQSHVSSILYNNGVTGITATQTPLLGAPTTTSALTTNVENFLSVTLITGASTTSCSSGSASINLEHY